MFEQVFKQMKEVINGKILNEVLTPEESERLGKEIATADIRPLSFDVSVEGWLRRLEIWGTLEFLHIDPENRIKQKVSRDQFFKRLTDDNLLKMMGQWQMELITASKLALWRDYKGIDGKKYKEQFVVIVNWKNEELRRAMR